MELEDGGGGGNLSSGRNDFVSIGYQKNKCETMLSFSHVLSMYYAHVTSRFVGKVNLKCLIKMIIVTAMNIVYKYKEEIFEYFY